MHQIWAGEKPASRPTELILDTTENVVQHIKMYEGGAW